jgi:hypothetical protein
MPIIYIQVDDITAENTLSQYGIDTTYKQWTKSALTFSLVYDVTTVDHYVRNVDRKIILKCEACLTNRINTEVHDRSCIYLLLPVSETPKPKT